MKLTYHKYFIEDDTGRYQYDMLPFLQNFVQTTSQKFKNSFFSKTGDNLFIFELQEKLYLFVTTKDREIIKTINSKDFSHNDIHTKLNADENIGFASYIYFGENFYGIASTFYGPKATVFNDFISTILNKLGLQNFIFKSMPFPVSSNRKEAINLAFKSSVTIDVTSENKLFQQLEGLLGKEPDSESISIKIKPKARNEMKNSFDSIINNLEDKGLKKYLVRGKKELEDAVTDFFIVGSGHISDYVAGNGENEICSDINAKINNNRALAEGLEEFSNDKDYSHITIESIARFNNPGGWVSYIQTSPFNG